MGLAANTFYQEHLNRVSRSFAFCIAELKSPLREWVGLAYILCRVADTLEDAQWPQRSTQLAAFQMMKTFAVHPYQPSELVAWRQMIPATIPEHEKALLQDADQFFQHLKALPEKARSTITSTLIDMIDGMAHFCATAPDKAKLQIRDLHHANQYCFFVAGIVGELLTGLFEACTEGYQASPETWMDAIHFGLFLQKINLLKDQMGDEQEGRFLVHSRDDFKQSLRENASGSLRYLTSLPVARRDFRLFCAWSLFLGLGSLPWIERAWREKSNVKIPRTTTAALLARVRLKIDDNSALRALFQELTVDEKDAFERANQNSPNGGDSKDWIDSQLNSDTSAVPVWIRESYRGRITEAQMRKLGMATTQD